MMAGLLSEPSLSFFLHRVHPFSAWILSKVQAEAQSQQKAKNQDAFAGDVRDPGDAGHVDPPRWHFWVIVGWAILTTRISAVFVDISDF
jgi:hypothetical protein